jgi:Mrp family chromosome partitioning ATPase
VSLLQEREKTAMELANTTDKGKLIDETQALGKLKPKTMIALLSGLIIGMLLPYVFFFVRRSKKKYIDSEIDLRVATNLPLLGTIPPSAKDDDDAFRLIRNNLLLQLGDDKKTILITSANEGDGKTFCATHLAEAFIRMGAKTICRNLAEIHPTGISDGINPADLLAHKGLRQAIADLRELYDIIILDGPEVDSTNITLVGSLADVTCFVCRPGKTTKVSMKQFEKQKGENSKTIPCVVLNK